MNWIKSILGIKATPQIDRYEQHKSFSCTGELYEPINSKCKVKCLFIECQIQIIPATNSNSHKFLIENLLFDEEQDNIQNITIELNESLSAFSKFEFTDPELQTIRGFSFCSRFFHYLFVLNDKEHKKFAKMEQLISQLFAEQIYREKEIFPELYESICKFEKYEDLIQIIRPANSVNLKTKNKIPTIPKENIIWEYKGRIRIF